MIFYHNNNLYKQKEGFHKFVNGAWKKIHNSFELCEVKERFMEIRKQVVEGNV